MSTATFHALNLDRNFPWLRPGEDVREMVAIVKAHPRFKAFDQTGDCITVSGFVDCSRCPATFALTKADYSPDLSCLCCPRCDNVDDRSIFPDARLEDVYRLIQTGRI